MKRIIASLICCFLLFAYASGEGGMPSDEMFTTAKSAASYIASGDIDTGLSLAGITLDTSARQKAFALIENASGSIKCQTEVSVAWQLSGVWYIAVPIAAPQDNMVPAIVFAFSDNGAVTGVSAVTWKDVSISYNQSESIVWNEEYNPSFIVIKD